MEVEGGENLIPKDQLPVRHLNNFYPVSAIEICFQEKCESRTIQWYWVEFSCSDNPYRQNNSLYTNNE